MNGVEIPRDIRQDNRTLSMPVVVVTPSDEGPDIRSACQLGANSYVTKPVEVESLIEAKDNLGFYRLPINRPTK